MDYIKYLLIFLSCYSSPSKVSLNCCQMDQSETTLTMFLCSKMEPDIISYYCPFWTLHSVKFKLPTPRMCRFPISGFFMLLFLHLLHHWVNPTSLFKAWLIYHLSPVNGSTQFAGYSCLPSLGTLNHFQLSIINTSLLRSVSPIERMWDWWQNSDHTTYLLWDFKSLVSWSS